MSKYPSVFDEVMVGKYPTSVGAGAVFFYDDVLEYRVWCHPHDGAPDEFDGNDYYHYFSSYEEALAFSKNNPGTEEPLVLVHQYEWINEIEPNKYVHEKGERLTEWSVEHLEGRKRQNDSIAKKLSQLKNA